MRIQTDRNALQQKADELNLRAWNARVSDSALSYNLSKEAIALSEKINYTIGKAQGYRTLGFCNIRLSKHDEAMPLLQEAEKLLGEE